MTLDNDIVSRLQSACREAANNVGKYPGKPQGWKSEAAYQAAHDRLWRYLYSNKVASKRDMKNGSYFTPIN